MPDVPAHMSPKNSFQGLILTLQRYWADHGCVVLQPYDMEMGAGTFHPATTLRALGPKPWNAAYVQPSRRPKDGRYGENPNRLQHYYQYQVILKPSPPDLQDLYLKSLYAIGIDPALHDLRFVEDDWESPTLGAWGLGWECWCDGMEVSQFTYFQQVAGFECKPVSGELTYGLERLAMYVQGVENVYDLNFNGREGDDKVTYGDIFLQAEQEYSRHNFEYADTEMLFAQFKMAEGACRKYLDDGWKAGHNSKRHFMALPAYDQCIKASHVFNLLDARGVISVTERQSYILRVRELAKACGEAWLATEGGGGGVSMPDLLLELFSEEIPARMQARAADDLKKLVTDRLVDAGLVYEGAQRVRDAAAAGAVRAGRAGAPAGPERGAARARASARRRARSRASSRRAGLSSINEATIQKDPKKGDFYIALIEKPGRAGDRRDRRDRCRTIAAHFPVAEVDALGRAVREVRAASNGCARCIRSSRPSGRRPRSRRSCVFDSTASGGQHDLRPPLHGAGADQGAPLRRLRGASSKRPRWCSIRRAAREIIFNDAKNLAFAQGFELVEDEGLLNEVAGLVEWPVVLMGTFDEAFLSIPGEVIRATIRNNQKCFVLRDPKTGEARQPLHPHLQHRGGRRRQGDHRRQ